MIVVCRSLETINLLYSLSYNTKMSKTGDYDESQYSVKKLLISQLETISFPAGKSEF